MANYPKIFFVIFVCSSSSLAYEIALTRIFSISLWYHFAFMIISIAMLGIGASGTVLSLYPKLRNISNIGIYYITLSIPFFFTGLIVAYKPIHTATIKNRIEDLKYRHHSNGGTWNKR